MKKKFKLILTLTVLFLLWQSISYVHHYFQPMEVMNVLKSPNDTFDDIVLKNPPLNERHFIRWWQENKNQIEEKYNVPSIDPLDDSYRIYLWDIADGYQNNKEGEEKPGFIAFLSGNYIYEQVCLTALPQEERCIEKENLYALIERTVSGNHYIDFANGNRYIQNKKGDFIQHKKK